MNINRRFCLWQGAFLSLLILFFGLSAVAGSRLTWETGKQLSPLTTRLSADMLQRLIDKIMLLPDVSTKMLGFELRNLSNETKAKSVLRKLERMPEPVTLAELAARVQLRFAIDRIQPHIQSSKAIKQDVRALELAWKSYSRGAMVLAEDASITAIALLNAGQIAAGISVLEFIEMRFVGRQGAWHRFDPKTGSADMDGQLADNAVLGLAFDEGYRVTGNSRWLDRAGQLAGFIFDRLYDRKLGGFFSRNSTSSRFYSSRELFVASKPLRSNGMAALLLYRVGRQTGEISYRVAAENSIAVLQNRALAARAVDIIDIVTTYRVIIESRKGGDTVAQGLQNTSFSVIVILSFMAGVLGFLSPCTLPILPAYFAFAAQSGRGNILLMTISFFSGLALVFSLMGATATMMGALLSQYHEFLFRTGGVLIILFGLASLLGKGFAGAGFRQRPVLSLAGSFFFGMTFSVGWTACIGPILAAMLVLAVTAKTAWAGAASLFIFALGLSFPLMILSFYLGNLDRNGCFWRFLKGKGWEVRIAGYPLYIHTSGIFSGLIFVSLGVLILTGYLTWLNRIFPVEIEAWVAGVEGSLMSLLGG